MSSELTSDYGDFVDSGDEDEVEAEAEPRERYEEGLYYPVRIGDVLDGRYHIRHKLGWGGFSTVWLAYDADGSKVVALKILIPGRGQIERDIEYAIFRTVRDPSRFVTHEAAFYVPGVQGACHMVLVYPVRGPSLQTTIRGGLPSQIRMAGAKELLKSLRDLHDGGVIHKDLSTSNVMWHLEPIDHYTTSDLYRRFGRPEKAPLPEAHARPGELVSPMRVPVDAIRTPVYMGDFGMSSRSTDAVKPSVQSPFAFCAPERYHGAAPSFASDMWSYTTIFASLYLGAPALPGEGVWSVCNLVGMMGPFPEAWRGLYCGTRAVFNWWYDHTSQLPRPNISLETIEQTVASRRPEVTEVERQHFLSVVRKGWHYEPGDRATAAELLEDPSFKALMAIYGV